MPDHVVFLNEVFLACGSLKMGSLPMSHAFSTLIVNNEMINDIFFYFITQIYFMTNFIQNILP